MAYIIAANGTKKEIDKPFILHPTSVAGVAIVANEVEFDISMLTDAAEQIFPVLAGLLALVTKTANYTALATDEVILCDATSGSFTISLPSVSGTSGKPYYIKKLDSSVNTVTIDATIDDGLIAVLTDQYESLTIVSNGTKRHII